MKGKVKTMKKTILTALCAIFAQGVFGYGEKALTHVTSGVTPGVWTSDFEAAKAYAESNNVPMLAYWGSMTCGWCGKFKRLALNTPEFEAWVKARPIVLLCTEATDTSAATEVKMFTRGDNTSGQFPYVRLYWPKAGQSDVSVSFSGRKDSIPGAGSSAVEQLISVLNKYFGSWNGVVEDILTPDDGYDVSGEFLVPGTEKSRLEYIPGVTSEVLVPLTRTDDVVGVATNVLRVAGGATTTVIWEAGERTKYVPVSTAGRTGDVALSLYYKGKEHAKSTIFAGEDPGNSPRNPAWIGEDFGFGEWTMDLDAALKKTKAAKGDAATIVFFTGALWCPWCLGIEGKVMETSEFTTFMRENQVSLVVLDERKRSPNDSTSAAPYAFSAVVNGAAPSLLSYDTGSNGASGAAYLSRKSIDPEDAAEILERNLHLGYPGGEYCAPEALRTGYPTSIILDKQGNICGRLVYQSDTSNGKDENGAYAFDKAENLARFKAFVALAKKDIVAESSKYATTTTLEYAFGAKKTVRLGVSENASVYKLTGVAGHRVVFKVDSETAGAGAVLSVLAKETVGVMKRGAEGETLETIALARGKTLATSSNGSLSYSFPATGTYYLKVASYANASSTVYGNSVASETSVTFHSEAMPQAAENDYVNVATSATVPVFLPSGDESTLVGTLTYSATAKGKIKVKYSREARKGTMTLSTAWSEVNYDGVAIAAITNGSLVVTINMDSNGAVSASVKDPLYGATLVSGESLVNPDFTPYKGIYTVALPVEETTSAGVAVGTGYAVIKAATNAATRRGRVSCQLFYPSGKTATASGTMEVLPDGWAALSVFKSTSTDKISLAFKIRPNAAEAPSHRAVIARDGVQSVWQHIQTGNNFTAKLGVYGSIYDKKESLLNVSGSDELTIDYDTDQFADSPNYGAISYITGHEKSIYVSAAKMTLAEREKGLSLMTTRATGVVRGKVKISFEEGRTLTASYRGVIIPNWNDCGCFEADAEIPLVSELPFVTGSVYYKETVGGVMVQRSFPFGFMPEE